MIAMSATVLFLCRAECPSHGDVFHLTLYNTVDGFYFNISEEVRTNEIRTRVAGKFKNQADEQPWVAKKSTVRTFMASGKRVAFEIRKRWFQVFGDRRIVVFGEDPSDIFHVSVEGENNFKFDFTGAKGKVYVAGDFELWYPKNFSNDRCGSVQ